MRTQVLMAFLESAEHDRRMGTTHVCIYLSLFRRWCMGGAQGPVRFTRAEIMRGAKVKGKATYHKCMRELHQFGYIRYIPSYDKVSGSSAYLEDG